MPILMQQIRWFVCVIDKWNVEKPVSSQPLNLLKLDFRYVFYYSCLHDVTSLSEKNAMEKLDFTSKNVINCVHNEKIKVKVSVFI